MPLLGACALCCPQSCGLLRSQANTWQEISPGGVIPSVRLGHAAVWSNAMDGFYVFGGVNRSAGSCVLSGTCNSFMMYLKVRSDNCCNGRRQRFE